MSGTTTAFVRRLVAAVPDLAPLLSEHLSDYDELLPHLLIGDVARDAAERFAAQGPASTRLLLAVLEGEAGRDPEVDEVIAASFVENLPYPGEPGAGLAAQLGPRLAAMLHQQRGGPA